jgi:thymidylate synthase (FAD)
MRLIKPSFEILTPLGRSQILKAIEVAGRTCYKSEDKITDDSASKFVEMIVGRGHLSVVEHQTVSVKFICDRGVSHELVRHRIASFSQESTRYCNYSKDKFDNQLTFIIPCWALSLGEGEGDQSEWGLCSHGEILWLNAMQNSQKIYNSLIQAKWSPQEARSVLPNSLKTEIVVTANLREWREIFRQRCSPAAHPQMRELMVPLRDQFKEVLPEIFGDGKE